MNPLVALAIEGVRTAISLAKNLIGAFSKNEAELELHNAALEKELAELRVEVRTAAQRAREKLAELDAPRRPSGPSGVEPFPEPGPTAPDPTRGT